MEKKLINNDEAFFNAFQPKQMHRYYAYIDGIPSYILKRVARPAGKYDIAAGKITWDDMNIEAYDPIVPSAAQSFVEWIESGKAKDMTIRVLGPCGDVVEEWFMKNCRIKAFDFGSLRWDRDDAVTISATLQIDYAQLKF